MKAGPALVLAAVVALTGCTADDLPVPQGSSVDVDTPRLRDLKQAAQVEDCVPGSATAADGGLPSVTLPCFGGGSDVDLSSLRGPMVVNLWGAWCGPCREELPVLAQFYADHGDRVAMLGVDFQDTLTEKAMKLAAKSGVRYPLVADPGGDLAAHAPFSPRMALPISVFVAADGSATVVPGEVGSEQELVDLVEQHLGIRL